LKLRYATHAAISEGGRKSFGKFDSYCWRFRPTGDPKLNRWKTAKTDSQGRVRPNPKRLSKDLKQRGFNFVGPTVTYAYMQAIGNGERSHRGLLPLSGKSLREFADAD